MFCNQHVCRIWIHCFRLALCLRAGSGTPECTLLTPAEILNDHTGSSASSGSSGSGSGSSGESETGTEKRRTQANSLSNNPAADHALAYTILDSGVRRDALL